MFKIGYYVLACASVAFLSLSAGAQTIERSVVASSGGEGSGGGAQITWTCGESVTASFQAGANLLTLGFQQLSPVNTTVAASSLANLKISVYPVPCNQGFFINGAFAPQKNYSYTLYNTLGSFVRKENIRGCSLFVETSYLEEGNYYLLITDENNSITSTFNIIKTK